MPHQNVTNLNLSGECIDGECYDDVLFHNLDSYIDNLQQDGIIVLHTIGSHGPTYYNRYPAEFKNSPRPAIPMKSKVVRNNS